jgi:ribosomal protein S18 acetylase RimI-like enzyme
VRGELENRRATARSFIVSTLPAAHALLLGGRRPPYDRTVIVEIVPPHSSVAYRALHELRPHMTDKDEFVRQVDEVQRVAGYRLLGAFADQTRDAGDAAGPPALAVAGFRITTDLAWGRHVYVDDLSTLPEARGRGYAGALLDAVHAIAADEGIDQVHLDSGVQAERQAAHRLYFAKGYRISAYHFERPVG